MNKKTCVCGSTFVSWSEAIEDYVCVGCGDVIENPNDFEIEDRTCDRCHGSGLSWDGLDYCHHCEGAGYEWWL